MDRKRTHFEKKVVNIQFNHKQLGSLYIIMILPIIINLTVVLYFYTIYIPSNISPLLVPDVMF